MIIERRAKDSSKRHIVASTDRVRQWLLYLFEKHPEFVKLSRNDQLQMSSEALEALRLNEELAAVDDGLVEHTAEEAENLEEDMECQDKGIMDAATATSSGLSETQIFSFDRYPNLYLRSKEMLKIWKEGRIEIPSDDSVRRPTSANLAFPHLYPNGEKSPLDFGDYKLGHNLLKKQSLFAHKMSDGKLRWNFAEDDIHMAHQYSRLCEQTVHANTGYYIGYYISCHLSVAQVPINRIMMTFKVSE